MKTSFKKNQLIITALAVMIAIAGYLKYSDSMIDSEQLAATSTSAEDVVTSEELEMDISAEDIYASTGITEEATELLMNSLGKQCLPVQIQPAIPLRQRQN